jgi:hypothetical protein
MAEGRQSFRWEHGLSALLRNGAAPQLPELNELQKLGCSVGKRRSNNGCEMEVPLEGATLPVTDCHLHVVSKFGEE